MPNIEHLRTNRSISRAKMAPNTWKWDEARTMQFVELYKSEPILWNMFSNKYRNKKARNEALERIVAALGQEGFGVADCKVKIKNLRTHYWQEITKVQNSMEAGADADTIYTPSVVWFHLLDGFLRRFAPHLNKTRFHHKRSSFDAPSTSTTVTCDPYAKNQNLFLPVVDFELENSFISQDSSTASPAVTLDEKSPSSLLGFNIKGINKPSDPSEGDAADVHPHLQPKKKTKRNSIQNLERALHALKEISKKERLEKPQPRSEYQLFGKLIVNQLEKLPEFLALESMKHIQAYLVDQRLKGVQSGDDATITNNSN